MSMQHIIITRFNIPMVEHTEDKNGQKTQTDAWMEERFALFEKFCMPSIMAQTNQNFQWVVLFGAHTSQQWRDHITAIEERYDRFTPLFMDHPNIAEPINELVTDTTKKVLTTRLDNDDALHKEYVEVIQKNAESKQDNCFLLFRFGYSFNGEMAVVRSHKYNPFSTFIECINDERAPIQTAYCSRHGRTHEVAPLHYIKERPFWLVGIHDRNAVNLHVGETRDYSLSKPKDVLKLIRNRYLRPLRRYFWPKAYRQTYTLADIQKEFGVK